MNLLDLGKKFFSHATTNLALITVIFYISGFLSFIAHYRVLGIENIEGSSQIYAEFAGRNLILIIETFLAFPFILVSEEINFNWGGLKLFIWIFLTLFLCIFYILAKFYLRPRNQPLWTTSP